MKKDWQGKTAGFDRYSLRTHSYMEDKCLKSLNWYISELLPLCLYSHLLLNSRFHVHNPTQFPKPFALALRPTVVYYPLPKLLGNYAKKIKGRIKEISVKNIYGCR